MPISVNWDNAEKSALFLRYEGRWTWEEYQEAVKTGDLLMDTVQHSVDLITFTANGEAMNPPPGAFRHWRDSMSDSHPNRGHVILIPGNLFIRTFVRIAKSVVGERYRGMLHTADSVEQARELLKKLREAQR